MTDLHVLRVFIGPDGRGGNPLGVIVAGGLIEQGRRQALAAELGFSETVFVDAVVDSVARIAIYTPVTELAFAGHPTVGTSWLLRRLATPVSVLQCRAGDVETWHEPERTWIRARAAWVHPIRVEELRDAAAVDAALTGTLGDPGRYVWAWEDEVTGRLRSRYFATDVGILEDEATGAAAVVMGDRLGRPLVIRQGTGSELLVRPDPVAGTVDVGGRVDLDEVRDLRQ